VQRLTRADVSDMVRAIVGSTEPMPGEILSDIWSLTEGNPFFVEEVLRGALLVGDLRSPAGVWNPAVLRGIRPPRTVQDAVVRRLVQVTPPAQRVLDLAAVAGRRFDFWLLRELTGLRDADVITYLRELVA